MVSGLSRAEVARVTVNRQTPPVGKSPRSVDWLWTAANLPARLQASWVVAQHFVLRERGVEREESLVGAFRAYLTRFSFDANSLPVDFAGDIPDARLGFDRVFELVGHTEGIWSARQAELQLRVCPRCAARYLSDLSNSTASRGVRRCPFCAVLERYSSDARYRRLFPARRTPEWTALRVGALVPAHS
jgi:flagellar transcriptional activator FlhC